MNILLSLFNGAKALSLTFYLRAIVIAIIVGFVYFNYFRTEAVIRQDQTLKMEKSISDDTLNKTIASQHINEQLAVDIAQESRTLEKQTDTIVEKTQEKVKAIQAQKPIAAPKPSPVPPTKPSTPPSTPSPTVVVDEVQYERNISEAYLDGLWEIYCLGNPAHPTCQNYPAPKEST